MLIQILVGALTITGPKDAVVAVISNGDWSPMEAPPLAIGVIDATGRISFDVPAEKYSVGVTLSGHEAQFKTGETDFSLQAGGEALSGTLVDEAGAPQPPTWLFVIRLEEGHESAIAYFKSEADGRYRVNVPRGRYLLGAFDKVRGNAFEPGDVAAPANVRLVLRPKPREDEASDAVVKALRSHAVAVKQLDFKGKRVVAVGEATHGNSEHFKMKLTLLQRLVKEHGFNVFAIEGSMPDAAAVNAWVTEGKGDPAEALSGMHFWTWDTEEMLALIKWMREWNTAHARKVKFYGVDMQHAPKE